MQIKIINVEKAKGTSKAGKPYEFIDVTYKAGDKTESKKLFMNDPIGVQVMGFKNGDFVEMTQTKVGDFWNWTSVALSTPQDIVNSAPSQSHPAFSGQQTQGLVQQTQGLVQQTQKATYVPDDQKQLLIVRQNCVGNAVKFHQTHSLSGGVHEVLKTASILEEYVYGRYAPPKEQKEGFADLEDNNMFDDSDIPS